MTITELEEARHALETEIRTRDESNRAFFAITLPQHNRLACYQQDWNGSGPIARFDDTVTSYMVSPQPPMKDRVHIEPIYRDCVAIGMTTAGRR